MAPTAYMIYTVDGKGNIGKAQEEALEDIRKIQGVEYAHSTEGVYDGIIKINAGTMDELKQRTQSVRRLDTISTTLTMIKIEG